MKNSPNPHPAGFRVLGVSIIFVLAVILIAQRNQTLATPPAPSDQYLACTIDDSQTGVLNNQWQYDSNWATATVSGAYQNDEHYAFTTNATAIFRFRGSQVKIYTVMEPAGGIIGYTLDNLAEVTASNYSPSLTPNSLSYTSPIVDVGDHTLVIRVTGMKDPAAGSNTITVDKAEVFTVGVNDSVTGTGDSQWDYNGTWGSTSVAGAFQNDEHYAYIAGDFVNFRFNGTGVRIYTVMEPHGGKIPYNLDNGFDQQLVNNYSPTIVGNSLSYTSPALTPGEHILKISVAGTFDPPSDSNSITVDKAEVLCESTTPAPTPTPTPTPTPAPTGTPTPTPTATPTPTPTPTPSGGPTVVDVNDTVIGPGPNQFSYDPNWDYVSGVGANSFQNDEHYAVVTNSTATFNFHGTQVNIFTVMEPHGGVIGYTLDSLGEVQFDNYSPTIMGNQLSYSSPTVMEGDHTLLIRVVGSHGMNSDSNAITVDRAQVTDNPAPPQVLTATVNDSTTGSGLNQFDYGNSGWSRWAGANVSSAFQGDEHYAVTTNVVAHFRFQGTQVKIYTVMEPHGGIIGYSLDGQSEQTADNYSPTIIGNALSYTSPMVADGVHDLVIRVTGMRNASSDANAITVDKAEVFGPPPQTLSATINDAVTGTSNNQWNYGPGWSSYSPIASAFMNDEHYAFTTNVTAQIQFNGTQIKIYTVKEPAGGFIGYTLDGDPEVQLSNYSPTTTGNTLSYVSPVKSSGPHTLVIRVVGSHENAARSNTITVDKAEVYVAPGP